MPSFYYYCDEYWLNIKIGISIFGYLLMKFYKNEFIM